MVWPSLVAICTRVRWLTVQPVQTSAHSNSNLPDARTMLPLERVLARLRS